MAFCSAINEAAIALGSRISRVQAQLSMLGRFYKTEIDSIAQFVEQECDIDAETRHFASKLYEAYRHYCQAKGRKPQSTNAFKKSLDKLTGVYQTRTASGMKWHGIRPLIQF